jgi:hypothetical protein
MKAPMHSSSKIHQIFCYEDSDPKKERKESVTLQILYKHA